VKVASPVSTILLQRAPQGGKGLPQSGNRSWPSTRLAGTYEFTLELTAGPSSAEVGSVPSEPSLTIFTAVDKQLGLKLLKVRDVLVDTIVVDATDPVPVGN
jgi:uncharacterized protein (TIGR03435 family)